MDNADRLIAIEHTRLVRIGYLIAAAFNLFGFLGNLLSYLRHGVYGLAIFTDYSVQTHYLPPLPVIAIILVGSSLPLALMVFQLIAFSKINNWSSYSFCLVVSAASIISFPIGTLIGLCSLIALARPSTKQLFRHPAA